VTQTTPEQNKALVLEAFDTLFNQRDYAAAARFWSDRYIQHSAHIEPGRDGLFNLVRAAPETLRYGTGSSWPRATLSSCMVGSRATAVPPPGSRPTCSESRTAASSINAIALSTGLLTRQGEQAGSSAAGDLFAALARSSRIGHFNEWR
jgi:hypothetical protein